MTTEVKQPENSWVRRKWRPLTGVTYIFINICDFVVFPVLWNLAQLFTDAALTGYIPLTLQAGGLFHLSFGAILGVAAWSRGQEKIAGVADS